jgi:DNA-binding response OmpR family regulator
MDDYLAKPVRPPQLLAAIERHRPARAQAAVRSSDDASRATG